MCATALSQAHARVATQNIRADSPPTGRLAVDSWRAYIARGAAITRQSRKLPVRHDDFWWRPHDSAFRAYHILSYYYFVALHAYDSVHTHNGVYCMIEIHTVCTPIRLCDIDVVL